MSTPSGDTVLSIEGLSVCHHTERGPLQALRDVSLQVPRGEIVGLVGESGCGKSTLISSVIRLLAPNTEITGGAIRFNGIDLLTLSEEQMRGRRGSELAMVFQDPMSSLNPVLTIGRQMSDIQYRLPGGRRKKHERSLEMLQRVGIADAHLRLDDYPQQLSGGMRQRVAIAMALMMKPALLIADEPTTALDATLEVQIIQQLKSLQAEMGCSILFISHHLGVIAELCDRVVVMYAGEVVESGSVAEIFRTPQHPYTRMLLACDPASIAERTRTLPIIPGSLPDLVDLPDGCVFRERCDRAADVCASRRPSLADGGNGRQAACHFAGPQT
ncbi:MAG: ABC transporter ATP-binding protein [Lysobacterales bacterium]